MSLCSTFVVALEATTATVRSACRMTFAHTTTAAVTMLSVTHGSINKCIYSSVSVTNVNKKLAVARKSRQYRLRLKPSVRLFIRERKRFLISDKVSCTPC